MKPLILTCNTGEGHNATASAIEEIFAAHNTPCGRADTLNYLSPIASRWIGLWHDRIYRHMPQAFDAGYRAAEKHPDSFRKKSPLYRILTKGVRSLYAFILKNDYDTIVCTHAFSALLVTALKEKYPSLPLITAFVATDYTCSPSVKECDMDLFFIPDGDLAADFIEKGVPADRIASTGLPVRSVFTTHADPKIAKIACGLPADKKHLLVMCGSMGCGPLGEMAALLCDSLPEDAMFSIICGTNKRLYRKLSRRFRRVPNANILGYVRNVPELMDASELYLTKPGGISITEATEKELPMVLVKAVAGCEEYNRQYLLERDMAITANTPEELCALCVSLLHEPDGAKRSHMQMNIAAHRHPDAAEQMYQQLCRAQASRPTKERHE